MQANLTHQKRCNELDINKIIIQERILIKETHAIRKKFYANTTLNEAKKLWMILGNRVLADPKAKYTVDNQNKAVITEIIKWIIMDKSFKGDLNKGIWLSGDIGTGKTMILKILCEFMMYADKIVAQYSALDVNNIFEERSPEKNRLFVSPLFIDDLGTEQPVINVYGTHTRPIYELLNKRYLDRRFLMFVTTNLSPAQIEERYGDRIRNRVKEMFNVMRMQGESRRY